MDELVVDFNNTADQVMSKVADVEEAKGRAETLLNNVITIETKVKSDYDELIGE